MNKEKLKNQIKKIFASKLFKRLIYSFGILIIIGIIFQAGVFVGFHKASFGRDWGDNYSRNFGQARHSRFGGMFTPEDFPNAHGAIGKIIKVELPNIIVLDKDGTEKIVVVDDDTDIRLMHEGVTKDKLTINSYVVVIGSPNPQGQIVARLIRILPAPLEYNTTKDIINSNPLSITPTTPKVKK